MKMKHLFFLLISGVLLFSCEMDSGPSGILETNQISGENRDIPLEQDLAVEFLLNGNLLDTSGNDNHGTIRGTRQPYSFVPGVEDQALFVDRKHDTIFRAGTAVEVPLTQELDLGASNFTLSYWIKIHELGLPSQVSQFPNKYFTSFSILDYHMDGSAVGAPYFEMIHWPNLLGFTSIKLDIQAMGSTGEWYDKEFSFQDVELATDQWHYVVISFDWDNPEGIKLSIDNQPHPSRFDPRGAQGSFYGFSDNMFLCVAGSLMQKNYGNQVEYDSIRIHKRILSDNEINSYYQMGAPATPEPTIAPTPVITPVPTFSPTPSPTPTFSPSPSPTATTVPQGLGVALDAITGASGTYTIPDASGNGNTLTYVGDEPVVSTVEGRRGLTFDGTSYLMNSGANLNIGTEDFSLSFSLLTNSSTGTILDKRDTTGRGYHIYIYEGVILFQMAYSSYNYLNYYATTSTRVDDGHWHDVRIEVDRNSVTGLKLFVDGQIQWSKNPTPFSANLKNSGNFYLGRHRNSGQSRFNGYLGFFNIDNDYTC